MTNNLSSLSWLLALAGLVSAPAIAQDTDEAQAKLAGWAVSGKLVLVNGATDGSWLMERPVTGVISAAGCTTNFAAPNARRVVGAKPAGHMQVDWREVSGVAKDGNKVRYTAPWVGSGNYAFFETADAASSRALDETINLLVSRCGPGTSRNGNRVAQASQVEAAPAQPPANPNHTVEAPWAKAFKANNDRHFFACMGEDKLSACEQLVSGTHQAYDPVASDPVIQHFVLPELFNYYRVLGEKQLKEGNHRAALASSTRGLELVNAHYDGGKHFHALTDGLGLFEVRAKALVAAGDWAAAEKMFGDAHTIAFRVVDQAGKANPPLKEASQGWKAAGRGVRVGAENNESWALALTERDGTDAEEKLWAAQAAERLKQALWFIEMADELRYSWVDDEVRWVRYARLGTWRAGLLGVAGQYGEATQQYNLISRLVLQKEEAANGDDQMWVPGLKSRLVLVRQNLCIGEAFARRDTETALLCQ